ncbi:MAG: hypothetical protein PHW54_05700 [Candidatus Omnitrophica bacterium]|nr:hypothetical protein [Candidatus Omnitrophota bacterium]
MKKRGLIKAIISAVIICFCFSFTCYAQEKKGTGSPVFVGDANLTYANYFFILPTGWIPLMDNMNLTHERGFFRAKHGEKQIWIQIVPLRKTPGDTLQSFASNAIQDSTKTAGCPADSGKEVFYFTADLNYPYKVYTINNCPQGTYGLLVLAELPQHFISFNLYGRVENASVLNNYTADFNRVLRTFRWVLGASDEEIGMTFKEMSESDFNRER